MGQPDMTPDTCLSATPAAPHCEMLAGGTPVYTAGPHRFGADALLLSRYSQPKPTQAACDLGSGCGIIPLRWHDAGHRGPCLAVELQPDAADLGQRALHTPCAAAAPFAHAGHIRVVCADLRSADWPALCLSLPALPDGQPVAPGRFDVVVCNPPYFTGGRLSQNAGRAAARHQTDCTLPQVAAAAAQLLRVRGSFYLCQRPAALAQALAALTAAGLTPKRLCFVRGRPDDIPWLFLVQARKGAGPGLTLEADILLQNPDGSPSDAARRLL